MGHADTCIDPELCSSGSRRRRRRGWGRLGWQHCVLCRGGQHSSAVPSREGHRNLDAARAELRFKGTEITSVGPSGSRHPQDPGAALRFPSFSPRTNSTWSPPPQNHPKGAQQIPQTHLTTPSPSSSFPLPTPPQSLNPLQRGREQQTQLLHHPHPAPGSRSYCLLCLSQLLAMGCSYPSLHRAERRCQCPREPGGTPCPHSPCA